MAELNARAGRLDDVWKGDAVVRTFIERIRGGVPLAEEQFEVVRRVIAARGAPVERIVDLGCGAGPLAKALLTWYPHAESTLVDFSEPMLDAARRELADHRPAPRFIATDLADPAWIETLGSSATFDTVVSGFAIHHLTHERKRALYAEVFTLLEPGGTFLNVEHVASHTPWIEAVSDELLVDAIFAFQKSGGSTRSRDQVAHEFAERPDKEANILAPVELQCEWLREIGFADVDCYFKIFELAVFGGRRPR